MIALSQHVWENVAYNSVIKPYQTVLLLHLLVQTCSIPLSRCRSFGRCGICYRVLLPMNT